MRLPIILRQMRRRPYTRRTLNVVDWVKKTLLVDQINFSLSYCFYLKSYQTCEYLLRLFIGCVELKKEMSRAAVCCDSPGASQQHHFLYVWKSSAIKKTYLVTNKTKSSDMTSIYGARRKSIKLLNFPESVYSQCLCSKLILGVATLDINPP